MPDRETRPEAARVEAMSGREMSSEAASGEAGLEQEETMAAENKAYIVIRADGNADIGVGHLMRCLTIAEQAGGPDGVAFWCADEGSAALVRDRGYTALVLGTDYRNMLQELPRLETLARELRPGAVILVDSYFVTEEYLHVLGTYARVYLLEDLPGRVWPVDGVINYNAFADRGFYQQIYRQTGQTVSLYIGAEYVPLRPQFEGRACQVRERARELLVTTGGGDRENIAGKILETIGDGMCRIHVVSGPYNPHRAWLDSYAADHPWVTVYRQVTHMAELMAQCDLAVTAGGTTVYELCALGVPFVCFSYAENQEALAEYAGTRKVGLYAGKYHQDPAGTLDSIGCLVRLAAADSELRRGMACRARQLVDGQGARRLAEALLGAAKCGTEHF